MTSGLIPPFDTAAATTVDNHRNKAGVRARRWPAAHQLVPRRRDLDAVTIVHATSQFVTPASFVGMLGMARHHWPGLGPLATGCLGTVVGVVILNHTPPATVQTLAPYALLLAGLLVMFQGPVQHRIRRLGWTLGPKTTTASMVIVGVYAGIIGVGTGTLALVVLGLTTRHADTDLQQLILTRNVLLLGMAGCVAVAIIPTGLIHWPLAAALAIPGAVGGWIGIKLIHRLPVLLLRALIAATAGAGAVVMWLA